MASRARAMKRGKKGNKKDVLPLSSEEESLSEENFEQQQEEDEEEEEFEQIKSQNDDGLNGDEDNNLIAEEEEEDQGANNEEYNEFDQGEDDDAINDQKPTIPFMKNNTAPDIAMVNMKIQDVLKVLSNLKEFREDGRSRNSYIEELAENLCTYYGYNRELIDLFLETFNPAECVQFLEANEKPRPSTIRTNTLKTTRKNLAQILLQRGVNLEPLAEWSKVGLKIIESKVPIGATPEYLAGHYMLQSASSFLPVISLAPQPNERVLDLAAAPGGKTTYISQLMKNTGCVVANDSKLERIKALKFNIQRLGINNAIIVNYDGRKFSKVMKGFDRVLLDAPCTGLGIIAKDQSIKSQRQYIDVKKMSHLQKELITAAIDCTKKGGYIIYSTCSITVEENEWVVDYALKNRFVKVVESGLAVGEEGIIKYKEKRFNPNIKLCRRIYPHVHNMDGFFVAKLKKVEDGVKNKDGQKDKADKVVKSGDKDKKQKKTGKEEVESENHKSQKDGKKKESKIKEKERLKSAKIGKNTGNEGKNQGDNTQEEKDLPQNERKVKKAQEKQVKATEKPEKDQEKLNKLPEKKGKASEKQDKSQEKKGNRQEKKDNGEKENDKVQEEKIKSKQKDKLLKKRKNPVPIVADESELNMKEDDIDIDIDNESKMKKVKKTKKVKRE